MKYIQRHIALIVASMSLLIGVVAFLPAPLAHALGGGESGAGSQGSVAQQAACEGSGGVWSGNACTTPGSNRTVASTIRQIANILIFLVGTISVLMMIIGAIRYTVAQGDNAAVSAAKNTVMYALVGIVVAFSAYGIVDFVLLKIQ